MIYDGQRVTIHGPKDAARLGIEVVYQDLALCDNLDVVQNMYLGREAHDRFQRLKEPPMEAKTRETLASLRVTTISSIRQAVATLSGGQRQSVAVARAVMWNSRLVILDEPTAALGVAQTEQVLGARQPPRRAGTRGRPDLSQPSRRVRDGDPDHRPAPRSERRRLRAGEDDAGGGRARDHGRSSDEGLRHHRDGAGGAGVTAGRVPTPETAALDSLPRRILDNVRTGNLGSGAGHRSRSGSSSWSSATRLRTSSPRRTSRTSSRRWRAPA